MEEGLRAGLGLELDVRANDLGIPVVENCPRENGEPLSLLGYLSCVSTVTQQLRTKPFLAIDVGSRGLLLSMLPLLRGRDDYFIYNVPGDELRAYTQAGLRVFALWSEDGYQRPTGGAVIDCLDGDWVPFELMANDPHMIGPDARIAVLDPRLRGYDPLTDRQLERLRCEYFITGLT